MKSNWFLREVCFYIFPLLKLSLLFDLLLFGSSLLVFIALFLSFQLDLDKYSKS